MVKRSILLCSLAVLVVASASCIFDPKESPPQGCDDCDISYKPLTQKENVLFNIQLAYNRRDIKPYDDLLDTEFTFFLAPGDVGGSIPEQWGRAEEVLYNSRLFDPDYAGPGPRCKDIDMDVKFEDNISWSAFQPPSHPAETWFSAVVFYGFAIDVEPDTQFHADPGARAQFVVRNIGTDDAQKWRLVEMSDFGGGVRASEALRASEQATWGGIKSLYR
jgi:hypothetical protein